MELSIDIEELKITSYLYSRFSNYDKQYSEIVDVELDLSKDKDVNTLLTFLRSWGCRQFKLDDNNECVEKVKVWYSENSSRLPSYTKSLVKESLVEASDEEIKEYSDLFNTLSGCYASSTKNGKKTFGGVGASKTLFALRKHMFPPWDNPIIEHFSLTKDGEGYAKYLMGVRDALKGIGTPEKLESLPTILNREIASLPKIIDEYLWITITRNIEPKEMLALIKNKSN